MSWAPPANRDGVPLRARLPESGWRGRPLAAVWPELDHEHRLRFARRLGLFTHELHALPHSGFPADWPDFRRRFCTDIGRRHAASGATSEQLEWLRAFVAKVGDLPDGPLVPLHTELIGQHLYVDERGGQLELTGLIDFADAMLGPAPYEFGALVGFIFQGERGLLREFLLGYGIPEANLTRRYSETLLAWSLHHRFSNLGRTLAMLEPLGLSSLDDIATVLYSLEPG